MPEFTYVGEDPRIYPDLGLQVEPGGTYELSTAPDHRFTPTEPPKSKPKKSEQE